MGSQFFSDPLGPKIRKIVEMGHYGPLFFGEIFFSQAPRHTGQEKPWGTRSRGGGAYDPPVDPQLYIIVLQNNLFEFKRCLIHSEGAQEGASAPPPLSP